MNLIQPRRFHPWKTLWVLLVVIAFAVFTWNRDERAPADVLWTGETMGTTYSMRIANARMSMRDLKALQTDITARLVEVSRQMSHYIPDSEISRFNQSASTGPFEISDPFARVLRFAIDLHKKSGGVFDPALGPLINLWGFGPAGRVTKAPSQEEIDSILSSVGCKHLSMAGETSIRKDVPGLQLNLSAVAKGYGVDEVARTMFDHGLRNYFVEIGGEVVALGHNAKGGPWRVGVEVPDPDALPGEAIEAVLEITNAAVATSGDYRNFFVDEEGHRFSHILNPRTGKPITHNLASVTVVADDCMTADGIATTLYVLGAQEGHDWLLKTYPGIEALFIIHSEDGTFVERATPGFEARTGYKARP